MISAASRYRIESSFRFIYGDTSDDFMTISSDGQLTEQN